MTTKNNGATTANDLPVFRQFDICETFQRFHPTVSGNLQDLVQLTKKLVII